MGSVPLLSRAIESELEGRGYITAMRSYRKNGPRTFWKKIHVLAFPKDGSAPLGVRVMQGGEFTLARDLDYLSFARSIPRHLEVWVVQVLPGERPKWYRARRGLTKIREREDDGGE